MSQGEVTYTQTRIHTIDCDPHTHTHTHTHLFSIVRKIAYTPHSLWRSGGILWTCLFL